MGPSVQVFTFPWSTVSTTQHRQAPIPQPIKFSSDTSHKTPNSLAFNAIDFIITSGRITSYNVCYTKLLRHGVFNPGKITDTPPMDSSLRTIPGMPTPEFDTLFDFSETLGFIRMAEQCNGSADCRKSAIIGGTMCPSYQATRDEDKTTRARANMLRNVLNGSSKANPFNDKELYQVLDLCLSCKGGKLECPFV